MGRRYTWFFLAVLYIAHRGKRRFLIPPIAVAVARHRGNNYGSRKRLVRQVPYDTLRASASTGMVFAIPMPYYGHNRTNNKPGHTKTHTIGMAVGNTMHIHIPNGCRRSLFLRAFVTRVNDCRGVNAKARCRNSIVHIRGLRPARTAHTHKAIRFVRAACRTLVTGIGQQINKR